MPLLFRAGRNPQSAVLPIAAVYTICVCLGCGNGSPNTPQSPARPNAASPNPTSSSAPKGDQTEVIGTESSDAEPGATADARPSRKSKAQSTLSGDTEPAGREGVFAIVSGSEPGGSLWEIDLPPEEHSVDRFEFVPPAGAVNSSHFAYVADAVEEGTLVGDAVELPEGFSAVAGKGYDSLGYPWQIRCGRDGSLMALIPEGEFIQGKDGRSANAAPEQVVFLDAYYIDVREITWERYEQFREQSRDQKRRVPEPAVKPRDPKMPVTGISWNEAQAYAAWTGRELPTEAQWEKGARGVDGFDYPWGNGTPVWHRARSPGQIDRVGSFRGDESPFGVFDMAGNAREWCSDWYQERYYRQRVKSGDGTLRNPTGPRANGSGNQHVVKGGREEWPVWNRGGEVTTERPGDVGFRCVLRLKK
ncbi:MAG: formylglycine-generating enzyme family protein [Planctomycetales bacterium]